MAFMQFFRTTAAALTSAIPAVVMFLFCTSWVLWVADSASPKPSSPWNVGDFLWFHSRKWKSVFLVTFIVNVMLEVSSTLTVRATTYSRPCYETNFLTCFANKLVQNKSFPLVKLAGGQGGQGHHGLLESPSKNLPNSWNFQARSLIESESGWIFMSFNCCIFSSTLEVVATTSQDPA